MNVLIAFLCAVLFSGQRVTCAPIYIQIQTNDNGTNACVLNLSPVCSYMSERRLVDVPNDQTNTILDVNCFGFTGFEQVAVNFSCSRPTTRKLWLRLFAERPLLLDNSLKLA